MPDPIFDVEALRKRALELLRQRGGYVPVGDVALGLQVPLWAADRALEEAYLAGEAEFAAGCGWRLRVREEAPAPDAHQFQQFMDLGYGSAS